MEQQNPTYAAEKAIYLIDKESKIKIFLLALLLIMCVVLFLPWTQNISTQGQVTSLRQEYRQQDINAPIAGRIQKWFVKEGDFVKKGDTIVILSEIKAEYLDPKLISRTQNQVQAKKGSVDFYQQKIASTEKQIDNLAQSQQLKTAQLENKKRQLNHKLLGDKAELQANDNESKLIKNQYERSQKMYDGGLISQTQFQQKQIQYQNIQAKRSISENKVAQTEQELLNLSIEQNSVAQEYQEKINKAQGDKFQNLSQVSSTQGDIEKLENQVSNYSIRNGMYIITAPQDGQIVQANKAGIGEIIKDGENISSIVPSKAHYAVEMYIKPTDLPLIENGQKLRLVFDGFPAIVFSGWPENSYGTFSGTIVAYERVINSEGKCRLLVSEDTAYKKWPQQLNLGVGAQGILLLKDVPIWYELWRNINGFPPDFYQKDDEKKGKSSKKAKKTKD
jgi:multidrug resistance efflux pump